MKQVIRNIKSKHPGIVNDRLSISWNRQLRHNQIVLFLIARETMQKPRHLTKFNGLVMEPWEVKKVAVSSSSSSTSKVRLAYPGLRSNMRAEYTSTQRWTECVVAHVRRVLADRRY